MYKFSDKKEEAKWTEYTKQLAIRNFHSAPDWYFEDALLCAYEGLAKAIIGYDSSRGASFKTFLNMRVQCEISNALRYKYNEKRDGRRCFPLSYYEQVKENTGDDKHELEEWFSECPDYSHSIHSVRTWNKVKENITAKEMEVLQLTVEGYSQTQIAEILDIKKSTVSMRLARMREKLRRYYPEEVGQW